MIINISNAFTIPKTQKNMIVHMRPSSQRTKVKQSLKIYLTISNQSTAKVVRKRSISLSLSYRNLKIELIESNIPPISYTILKLTHIGTILKLIHMITLISLTMLKRLF